MVNTVNIKTQNISFKFNEDVSISDIKYKEKTIISKIYFTNILFQEIRDLKKDYRYLEFVEEIFKNIKWKFKYESKKKSAIIFINGNWEYEKLLLSVNFIIRVNKNTILIQSLNNCNTKAIFGITINIIPSISNITFPAPLLDDNRLHISESDEISLISKDISCKILTTFSRLEYKNKVLNFAPQSSGKHRDVMRAWTIRKNNKNFNVINISFL